MDESIEIYGNILLDDNIIEGATKESPICLEYYKIHNDNEKHSKKPYGIGIMKTYHNKTQTNMEKTEFSHIFRKEKEVDNMLKLLIENAVTPVSLKDVLEDFVLV